MEIVGNFAPRPYEGMGQLELIEKTSAFLRRQCTGATILVSRTGGIPGLSMVGDALGINATADVQDRSKALFALTMLVTLGYLVSPMFMFAVLFALGAGVYAYSSHGVGQHNANTLGVGTQQRV